MKYLVNHVIKCTPGGQNGVSTHGIKNTKKSGRTKRTEGKRAMKEMAQQEIHKLAITDHCKKENHIMARVIRTEDHKYRCWIREAMEIRRQGSRTINRDE